MENQNQNWQDLLVAEDDETAVSDSQSAAITQNIAAPQVAPDLEPEPESALELEPELESAVAEAGAALSVSKLEIALKLVARLELDLQEIKELLSEAMPGEAAKLKFTAAPQIKDNGSRVVEGVFDGEKMVGADGEIYSVPANYASKSKLVEGDIMKLTITGNGMFIFKQISPIERQRITGVLAQDEDDNYWAEANGKQWRVLTASATYFKGEPGDEITILVPKGAPSRWAGVENIVKNRPIVSQ